MPTVRVMHPTRVRNAPPLGALAALLLTTFMTGCASSGGPSTVAAADAAWDSGDYRSAHEIAARTYERDPDDAAAAYVAGISLIRLDRKSEAIPFLQSAARDDGTVGGRASAALGTIQYERGRFAEAAAAWSVAANRLDGVESSQARFYAANAAARAGVSVTSTAAPSRPASVSGSGFAIQLGAFSQESNARRRASEVGATARRIGLGEPRVVRALRGERILWIVQVGWFPDRRSALAAQRRLATGGTSIERVVQAG